jgi:hypothetical protein
MLHTRIVDVIMLFTLHRQLRLIRPIYSSGSL